MSITNKTYLTLSSEETRKIGKKLAEEIAACSKKNLEKDNAFLIALQGDLGGGKTTFLQGFAKGLGIKEKILSPTFVILKKFQIPPAEIPLQARQMREKSKFQVTASSGIPPECGTKSKSQIPSFKYFYHIDCYRIQKTQELLELDFKEIIFNPKNIVAIEWAEKIKKILPKEFISIKFEFKGKNKRKIII